MAGTALVNATGYGVLGGKCMVKGTVYSIGFGEAGYSNFQMFTNPGDTFTCDFEPRLVVFLSNGVSSPSSNYAMVSAFLYCPERSLKYATNMNDNSNTCIVNGALNVTIDGNTVTIVQGSTSGYATIVQSSSGYFFVSS